MAYSGAWGNFNTTLTALTGMTTSTNQPWTQTGTGTVNQPWVQSPSSNPYNLWGSSVSGVISSTYPDINKLKYLKYVIDFYLVEEDDDEDDDYAYLSDYVSGIRKNKIIFNGDFEGNRMQPYETIMRFIQEHKKMSVKIHITNLDETFLIISYSNFEFTEIQNNLNFNDGKCDFSVLKVKFKYDTISYENKKLTLKELREDKLKKINKLNESSNN